MFMTEIIPSRRHLHPVVDETPISRRKAENNLTGGSVLGSNSNRFIIVPEILAGVRRRVVRVPP